MLIRLLSAFFVVQYSLLSHPTVVCIVVVVVTQPLIIKGFLSAPFNSVNKKAIVGRYCCHASLCKEGFLRILLEWLLGNSHLLPTVNINYVVLCFLFLMSGRKLFKNSFVFFFLAIVVDLFRRIVRRAVPWEPFSSLASIFLLRLW